MKLLAVKLHQPVYLPGIGQIAGQLKISDDLVSQIKKLELNMHLQAIIVNDAHCITLCNICNYTPDCVELNKFIDSQKDSYSRDKEFLGYEEPVVSVYEEPVVSVEEAKQNAIKIAKEALQNKHQKK